MTLRLCSAGGGPVGKLDDELWTYASPYEKPTAAPAVRVCALLILIREHARTYLYFLNQLLPNPLYFLLKPFQWNRIFRLPFRDDHGECYYGY